MHDDDDTKQDIFVGTRVSKPELAEIEAWRSQASPIISRSEAIRLLLRDALARPAEHLA
jgi:hypothetical protein